MDEVKSELFKSAAQLIPLLTLVLLAWMGNILFDLKKRAAERDKKVEETRENVSRLINGKGVQHDAQRAAEALDATKAEAGMIISDAPTKAPSIAPHAQGET